MWGTSHAGSARRAPYIRPGGAHEEARDGVPVRRCRAGCLRPGDQRGCTSGTGRDAKRHHRGGGMRSVVQRAGQRRTGAAERLPMGHARDRRATSAGSYAVNRGRGVRVGDIDTGIDLTNTDIMPNVDWPRRACSCTPTRRRLIPAEQVTRGDCSNKAALQDYAGHGTHTAGTIAAPINGMGVVRRRARGDGRRAQGRDRAGVLLHPVGRRRAAVRR